LARYTSWDQVRYDQGAEQQHQNTAGEKDPSHRFLFAFGPVKHKSDRGATKAAIPAWNSKTPKSTVKVA
jgi:hypothetical protein